MALTRFRNHQLRDFDYKNSVRVATTTNIASISGGATNLVDGITLVKSDRILVKDQSTSSENGIYEVITVGTGSNGTWARSADANTTNGILNSGATVFVSEGTANTGTYYRLLTADPITVGVTGQTWSVGTTNTPAGGNTQIQFNSSGAMSASSNLTFNGSQLTAPQLVSNIAIGTAPLVVTSTTQVANLNVANAGSATTAATVTTAAQPNITSVGTLTSLGVSGALTATGVTNLGPVSNVIITGGSSNQYLRTDGAGALSFQSLSSSSISNGNSNVTVVANANVNISSTGVANILVITGTGVVATGTIDIDNIRLDGNTISSTNTNSNIDITPNGTGNINLNNPVQTTSTIQATQFISNIAIGTAPLTVTSTTQVANLNVATAGSATTAGTVTTAAQPNITSVGTLSSLGVSGAVTASTLVSNIAIGTAPFTVTSTTQVANLNVATAGSATTAGTVTTAAQPNITGVGTLTSLTTNGRIQVTLDGSADTGVTNNTTMLELLDNGATSTPSMAFHRPSVYATKIVLSTDNILYFGGWSAAIGGQSIATGTHLPGANATYALGSTSLRWSNIWGLASSAQYADLAEMYQADAEYSPATVMVFGGKKEITSSTITHDTAVAGVISTQPAYLMNDESDRSGIWLPLALTGRVPCLVKGPVKKGDVLVTSSTPGVAEKINNQSYVPGCVIGKSLEEYLGTNITTIEVVVGRF